MHPLPRAEWLILAFVVSLLVWTLSGCEALYHAVVLPRPIAEACLQERHDVAGWGPSCTVMAEWMRAHSWAVSIPGSGNSGNSAPPTK